MKGGTSTQCQCVVFVGLFRVFETPLRSVRAATTAKADPDELFGERLWQMIAEYDSEVEDSDALQPKQTIFLFRKH